MTPSVLLAALATLTAALGGTSGGLTGRPVGVPMSTYTTSAALTLYVSTTGNDNNACTSTGTAACLTIQGAINKVPKLIKHAVTINIAAGNYTGAFIEGFTFAGGTTNASLTITGTLVTATPATGSATGTATSSASGSAQTFTTITDSGATWTTNDFAGKLVTTTGTGAGTYLIASNTGTAITLAGATSVSGTPGYTVKDWGAVINTAVTSPTSVTSTAGSTCGLCVDSNVGVSGTPDTITVQQMSIVPTTSARALRLWGSAFLQLFESNLSNNAGTVVSLGNNFNGHFKAVKVAWAAAGLTGLSTSTVGTSAATSAGAGVFQCANCVVRSFNGFTADSLFGLQITSSMIQTSGNNRIALRVGSYIDGTLQTSRIDCASGTTTVGLSTAGSFTARTAGQSFGISNIDISNCVTGMNIVAGTVVEANTNTGSSNTTMANVTVGGKLVLSSASTMTGTTELSLDGTAYTLAQVRALVPKNISNAYLSDIYEP